MLSRIFWPIIVLVTVAVGAVIPLVFDPGYYYADDSQAGAYGQWFEIGRRVLDLDFSTMNPLVWQSGNYLAEGAWGVFSPLLWVIGLLTLAVPSAVALMTGVKIAMLLVLGLGSYLLTRTFDIAKPLAAVAAVAIPLAGFTLYIDAPSWVNGLIAFAFWPLSWALARRAAFRAGSPLLAVLAFLCLIGMGYVHATVFLGLALLATAIEALASRNRRAAIRSAVLLGCAVLFGIVVHLPGLLTAPNTGREGGTFNNGLLTTDISGLFTASTPAGTPNIRMFSADFPQTPLLYIAWFLPLLTLVDWRRLWGALRVRPSLVIVGAVALVGVLLPSNVGPLRFPIRMMPYLTTVVVIIAVLALAVALVRRPSRRRIVAAGVVVLASTWLTWAQGPQHSKVLMLSALISLAGIAVVALVLHRSGDSKPSGVVYRAGVAEYVAAEQRLPSAAERQRAGVAAVIIAIGVLLLVPQHYAHPSTPLPNYSVPSAQRDYQKQLDGALGDVLVAGGVSKKNQVPAFWDETLVGNLWYVNGQRVQNAYSAVYYPGYNGTVCMNYNGSTCGELYGRLFERLPDTGLTLADALGVSSVQAIKAVVPRSDWSVVPAGWSVVDDTKVSRLIVRDTPVPGAGSVVLADGGAAVTVTHEDNMGVTFRVDENPGDGRVVLSRIPWPGYTSSAGSIMADPVDKFLMGVDLSGVAPGTEVTVSYWSPGWPAMIAAIVALALITLGWTSARIAGRTRRVGASSHRWATRARALTKE